MPVLAVGVWSSEGERDVLDDNEVRKLPKQLRQNENDIAAMMQQIKVITAPLNMKGKIIWRNTFHAVQIQPKMLYSLVVFPLYQRRI